MRTACLVHVHRMTDSAAAYPTLRAVSPAAHRYEACDELGVLIYSGPYGGVQCPGCDKLASASARLAAAVGRYQQVLLATASHPSHVARRGVCATGCACVVS